MLTNNAIKIFFIISLTIIGFVFFITNQAQHKNDFVYTPEKEDPVILQNQLNELITEAFLEKNKTVEVVKSSPKLKTFDLNSLKKIDSISIEFIKGKSGLPTLKELNELSAIYSIPENLLHSLMIKESMWDMFALSNKNARGLFQFLPETAIEFGLVVNNKLDERTDPWKASDAAARYLTWIFTYLHPDIDRSNIDNYKYVLAGYNAGINNVKRGNKLSIPNFQETINYVNIIIGHAKGDLYLVKRGDKLKNIASRNGLNFYDLRKMNLGITQKQLIAGSYLLVNKDNFSNKHTVNRGESLYSIAKRYSISINDIMEANNLNDSIINIGQKIHIPF